MTLEAAIQENTAAVRDLIAAINAQAAGGTAVKVTNTTTKTTKAATTSPVPAPAEKAKEPAAPAPAATDSDVTYQEASKAVIGLKNAKGRDAAVAVLAQFNAKNLQEVKPEDFAAVVKACQEAAEA